MSRRLKRPDHLKTAIRCLADLAQRPLVDAARNVGQISQSISKIEAHRIALLRAVQEPSTAAARLAQAERLRMLQAQALTELAKAQVEWNVEKARAAKALARDRVLVEILRRDKEREAKKSRRNPY